MPATLHGQPPYDPVVADAIAHVHGLLPAAPPHTLWQTHELRERADGRRHALPLLVLTHAGLFVVHVHRHQGVLHGNDNVWRWVRGQAETVVEAPFAATEALARQLREHLAMRGTRIEVRPLVLLGATSVSLAVPGDWRRSDLVRRDDSAVGDLRSIRDALLGDPATAENAVGRDAAAAVADALRSVGVVEASHRTVVGAYRLGDLLADHQLWQEHDAVHIEDDHKHARVRTWTLPRVEDAAQRAALHRAAVREAEVLDRIGRHPNILGLIDTVEHEDLPRLVFEPFAGAVALHRFVRLHRDLSFDHKLDVLEQIADALDHCHRHDVVHRNLSPDAVLVRFRDGVPQVRLHRFEGAVARLAESTSLGTRHLDAFSERLDYLYQAPEIFHDARIASAQSDLFSLGALAWYLFTGQHPGPTLPARQQRLADDEGLRLWRVRDDLDDELDELIAHATRKDMDDRPAAVRGWINKVLGLYRGDDGEPDAQPVPPLDASPGDALGEGLVVVEVLGSGASARVLAVDDDGVLRAVKVPHDLHAERLLLAEADVLRKVGDQAGIVRLVRDVRLSDTTCLLLQHAGRETLTALVKRTGTLALDYVQRLGDELLEAVDALHERGITHRDIKPSNLAFTTASNQPRRLVLFDFSLAALPARRVRAGTPSWRDPFLVDRGEWDAHADLWAVACVLHYALTGERPEWNEQQGGVRIVDSRFDPDLRGALAGFFRRALAPDVADRYLDAAAMRHGWGEVFAGDVTSITPHDEDRPDPRLSRARLDTPIGALGFSARALNALERAGVATVRDLLGLPRNRLSQVRGVGSEVRAEIGTAVDSLDARLGSRDDAQVTPFLDAEALLPFPLDDAGLDLPRAALDALHDAGLRSTRDLAEAGAERVARLLHAHGVDLDRLRRQLSAAGPDLPPEGAMGDWVGTLLRPNPQRSKRTKWETRLGMLIGLDPLPADAPDPAPPGGRSNGQVADALGDRPAVFRASFQNARTHWDRHPVVRDAAVAAIGEALDRLGPVAPIPDVATALLAAHAPQLEHSGRARCQAIALVRFGTEAGIPSPPFEWRRIGRHAWIARTAEALDALQALAIHADRMAAHGPPVALEAALHTLEPVVVPPLDGLDREVLLQRAVAASDHAALSPRLEVYAAGLPARRAVELSAAVLTPGLGPDAIRKRVAARYPEAQPVPGRPELDALMSVVGQTWETSQRAYHRPGAQGVSLTGTAALLTTTSSWRGVGPRDSGEVRARNFDESLQRSLQSGRFRVIQASARRAEAAVRALQRSVPGLVVTSLDREIWTGLQARIAEAGAQDEFVLSVDRDGPEGAHWRMFVDRFVRPVVDSVVSEVLARREAPRLLIHPGLLARYGLTGVLDRLVRDAESGEGAAIWMLLPAWDDAGKPLLRHPHGDLPVPTWLPGQRLRAPTTWIRLREGGS